MEIDGAFLFSDRQSSHSLSWMDDHHRHESMRVEESIMDQETKKRLAVD